MITHDLIQGTPEWLQHRRLHLNAADAPAMTGCSPYTTRTELLHRMKTGITPEVDAGTQKRFNDGHRFEALARPLAAEIIGEDLYPVTGSEGELSASFDGLTADDSICFEHKTLNDALRAAFAQMDTIAPEYRDAAGADELPLMYRVQMEQQLLVSGAEKCLFMASKWDNDHGVHSLAEERHCWYESDPVLRAKIIDGWKQFAADLAAYVPTETVEPAVAKMASILPVVFDMRVEGKLVSCNLEQYKPAALAYIKAINTALVTDQDFADADADAKYCRDSADKLELAIEQALGQMGDINAAMATVREIAAAFDAKGLALEKLVKSEKDNRKIAIIQAGKRALDSHEDGLQERTQRHLPRTIANFETVAKGLKKIDSIQNAVDTELARCKIEASAMADKIEANLKAIAKAGHEYLFVDADKLVVKAPEDLANTITARIAAHQAKEAARVEADRARIRQEEIDRLAQEQAEADRVAAKAASDAVTKAQRDAAPTPQAVPFSAVVALMPAAVRKAMEPPANEQETPTLKMGKISTRLGFLVSSKFLAELGFPPALVLGNALLYRESDFPGICAALIAHIESVCETVAAAVELVESSK
jgi:putative phage-type endonuclease